MATNETIDKALREIAGAYPGRMEWTPDTVKIWAIYLVAMDDGLLMTSMRSFISSSDHAFPPSIPELRKEAARIMQEVHGIPDVWEAWEDLVRAGTGEVTRAVEEDGQFIAEHIHYKFKHSLVEQVARGLGWPERFPRSDMEVADRAAFRDAYSEALKKFIKGETQLPGVKQFISESRRMIEDGVADVARRLKA